MADLEENGKTGSGSTREEREKAFQERQKRFAEIQDRKVNLAKERNSRVVLTRTRDTLNMLSIIAPVDKAIERLRGGMGYLYNIEEVASLLNEYMDISLKFNDFAEKICKKADVPYRAPRWVNSQSPLPEERSL